MILFPKFGFSRTGYFLVPEVIGDFQNLEKTKLNWMKCSVTYITLLRK